MSNSNTTEAIEALAATIGENVYIDVAKWRLFLAEAHLHTVVAEKAYPLLQDNSLTEDKVLALLGDIPVKLGGGKTELPLRDLISMQSQIKLIEILEEFQDKF
ncbi:DUF3181 family protein [Gloeocapsa sp. PCC 73106]|uniref:DUF3181 family protein n=1 Tax=Gloeocapsa sp. PCC 73106 TaxID=102232 RepID=UPI0002AC0F0A|nr:DUF3181 family protein [Gloeocapsa sp. PCC 73106]ELR96588.1 Protein of unknown function (DUF3181) [Gloeocapsa sp. PCC 73106]